MDMETSVAKAKEMLDELDLEYRRLKEKARIAKIDAEIDIRMKMDELKEKQKELEEDIRTKGQAGKESWKVLAEGFEKAAGELKEAFGEAWKKLG